jgi:integrase/recombinase XerD
MSEDEVVESASGLNGMLTEIAMELQDELGVLSLELVGKRLPAVPSAREVRTLLDCAKDAPRDYLILRLLYFTGMRVGELANVRFADVSHDEGTIFVRAGKGDKDRYVCVDAKTLRLVRQAQGSRPLDEIVVEVQERQINRVVDEYGRCAGLVQKYEAMLRSFSPHSLRHAFATHRYDSGMDLAVLQKLLGHRYIGTTLIYVETSMRQVRKQYRQTNPKEPHRGRSSAAERSVDKTG